MFQPKYLMNQARYKSLCKLSKTHVLLSFKQFYSAKRRGFCCKMDFVTCIDHDYVVENTPRTTQIIHSCCRFKIFRFGYSYENKYDFFLNFLPETRICLCFASSTSLCKTHRVKKQDIIKFLWFS